MQFMYRLFILILLHLYFVSTQYSCRN